MSVVLELLNEMLQTVSFFAVLWHDWHIHRKQVES